MKTAKKIDPIMHMGIVLMIVVGAIFVLTDETVLYQHFVGWIVIVWALCMMRFTAGKEGRMTHFTNTKWYKESKKADDV